MITSYTQTIPQTAVGDFARAYQPGNLILLPNRQTNVPIKWRVIAFESLSADSHPRFGNQASVTITLEQVVDSVDPEPEPQFKRFVV